MKRLRMVSLCCSLLGLLAVASVSAEETVHCPTLAPDTRFVDLEGNAVDPAQVDALAFKETGSKTVFVYRRTAADAEALVRGLVADGESDPAVLAPDTWLMAQGPAACQMRPGNRCGGNCPGRQTCKRVKRPGPGRDICRCML